MPEITDADMQFQEIEIGQQNSGPLRTQFNLFLAVWAQFCYVGAQVAVAVSAFGRDPCHDRSCISRHSVSNARIELLHPVLCLIGHDGGPRW